jgi:hypothetical protein
MSGTIANRLGMRREAGRGQRSAGLAPGQEPEMYISLRFGSNYGWVWILLFYKFIWATSQRRSWSVGLVECISVELYVAQARHCILVVGASSSIANDTNI